MHPLFDLLAGEIRTDIAQMAEEGHDERALLDELARARASGSLDALARLQEDLWHRPSPPGFPYQEPSDWQGIAAGFPDPDSHARLVGGDADLADRLLGGWLGRCAGCQLGKPVEGLWPDQVETLARAVGSWPLEDYFRPVPDGQYGRLAAENEHFQRLARSGGLVRGAFRGAAPDDDIHYAVTSLLTLQRHGCGFTTEQAIATLIEYTLASGVYAAGRNMVRTYLFGLRPPHTAMFGNPFRQSLGAQIRCDAFGWAAPANPALAARMAFTDAAGSQTRNGIYSGIFFAVLLADVLAHGDVPRAIATAAGYVPPRSRFAEMLTFIRARCAEPGDWQQVNPDLYGRYDRLPGRREKVPMNHCLINAGIVVMALLKGGGDFTRSVGVAVMAGRDTDCNGATAGSVLGCALGTRGIDRRWTEPLADTIRTHLKGMPELGIARLAEQTFSLARPNARFVGR